MASPTESQLSLVQALDFPVPTSGELVISLSDHPCFGNAALGGYIAAVLQKVAVLYASQHPLLQKQPDVRSAITTYVRPVFPSKGTFKVKIHELGVGKAWSFLRTELYEQEGTKLCACAEVNITNFSIPGVTLDTRWKLTPPPQHADLANLEDRLGGDEWACYHTPYYPNGFRRAHSYAKYFFPRSYDPSSGFLEHWILPGWDCFPQGSRDLSIPEARWTNELLPIVADLCSPLQENYFPREDGKPLPIGGVASALQFAATQKEAYTAGKPTWRAMQSGARGDGSSPDGIKAFMARKNTLNSTINMAIEFKKRLPKEGVRWLYMRGEVKSVCNGRQDWQVLCFDQEMNLLFIRNGVEQILDPNSKAQRKVKEKASL